MLKFNKHNVTNTETKEKARIHYSLDNRIDNRKCVTLYAKDYNNALSKLFTEEYKNDSDMQTDYFETGRVVLFEDNKHYAAARKMAEQIQNERGSK